MQIAHLDHIRLNYQHVYLSPHLDDAVLSCGGAILQQRLRDECVLVVTLCTAPPSPSAPLSTLAEAFHTAWQLAPAEVVSARLHEDEQAMAMVGADYLWAGLHDAIYRYPQAYHNHETLFHSPAPGDPLLPALRQLIAALRQRLPAATFYAPLGVGSHVDHLLTHTAAGEHAGSPTLFYEDLPYATHPEALETRLAALANHWSARTIDISATLSQKLAAIAAYASQMADLFGGSAPMVQAMGDYAHTVAEKGGSSERVWLPQP